MKKDKCYKIFPWQFYLFIFGSPYPLWHASTLALYLRYFHCKSGCNKLIHTEVLAVKMLAWPLVSRVSLDVKENHKKLNMWFTFPVEFYLTEQVGFVFLLVAWRSSMKNSFPFPLNHATCYLLQLWPGFS